MTKSIGAKELAEYKFTHEEMARLLGISSNALRMRMRNGNHDEFQMSYIKGKKMYKRQFRGASAISCCCHQEVGKLVEASL